MSGKPLISNGVLRLKPSPNPPPGPRVYDVYDPQQAQKVPPDLNAYVGCDPLDAIAILHLNHTLQFSH
jgi:hypothetical protein